MLFSFTLKEQNCKINIIILIELHKYTQTITIYIQTFTY